MAITLSLPLQPKPELTLWQYVLSVQIWTNECHAMLQTMVDAINAGSGGIPDAPSDGTLYGRKNAAWVAAQPAGSYLTDAPSDGSTYGRKNGAWSTVASTSFGNLTEATSSILTITGGVGAVAGSGTSIQVKAASGSQSGYLSSTDWTTFNGKQSALTIGNFAEATSSVLTISGGTGAIIGSGLTVQVKLASGSQSGYLSSTDWTTFNNKQAAGSYLTDAPSDGTIYGRQNAAWVNAATASSTDVLQVQVMS